SHPSGRSPYECLAAPGSRELLERYLASPEDGAYLWWEAVRRRSALRPGKMNSAPLRHRRWSFVGPVRHLFETGPEPGDRWSRLNRSLGGTLDGFSSQVGAA